MSSVAFAPARGTQAVQDSAKSDFTPHRKIQWLSALLKESGSAVRLRFLTDLDNLVTVKTHAFTPTKAAPAGAKNWPKTMSCTCRNDEAFQGGYADCYPCLNPPQDPFNLTKTVKAKAQTFALACLREVDEKTGVVSDTSRKVMVKVKDDEEPVERSERALVVVCMTSKTFWKPAVSQGAELGSLCTQDFVVKRSGKGLDTRFDFIAKERDEVLNPNNPGGDGNKIQWSRYLRAIGTQGLDLDDLISYQGSDEYHATFIDPRFTVNADGVVVPTGVPTPGSAAEAAQTAETMSAVDRLKASLAPKASPAMDDDDDY